MSAASRWEAAGTRIAPAKDPRTGRFVTRTAEVDAAAPGWPSLSRNSAGVAGGLGFELPAPVEVCGFRFDPQDGGPFACPIGAALAYELAAATA